MARRAGIDTEARALHAAGFRGRALLNMLAIAGRESRYVPTVHNSTYPDDSRGELQINVLPGANPKFRGWNLYDPYVNARAAHELFKAAGYKPWVGVGYGNARSFLPAARRAVGRLREERQGGGGRVSAAPVSRSTSVEGLAALLAAARPSGALSAPRFSSPLVSLSPEAQDDLLARVVRR